MLERFRTVQNIVFFSGILNNDRSRAGAVTTEAKICSILSSMRPTFTSTAWRDWHACIMAVTSKRNPCCLSGSISSKYTKSRSGAKKQRLCCVFNLFYTSFINFKVQLYCCHLCRGRYQRGTYITSHLKRDHKHTRCRYRRDHDGMFRLQTIRFKAAELAEEAAIAVQEVATRSRLVRGRLVWLSRTAFVPEKIMLVFFIFFDNQN